MKNKDVYDEHESAKAGFTKFYADGIAPWEIGKPQPPFVAVAEHVLGPVLDAGCGTGNAALFFAARGLQVSGIDFVEYAIRQARAKAAERGLSVEFLVKDAMTLIDWDRQFASVIDSGLFHVYHGNDRHRYVRGLSHVLKPGGRLFLFCFSDEVPSDDGGVSKQELYETFSAGWEVESIQLVRDGEINPSFRARFPQWYPNGGPAMWFAVIRRQE
jgi:SAM-dependent methyltransferase